MYLPHYVDVFAKSIYRKEHSLLVRTGLGWGPRSMCYVRNTVDHKSIRYGLPALDM